MNRFYVLPPICSRTSLISLFLNSVPLSIRTFSDPLELTIKSVNIGLNHIFCTLSLKWYAEYKSCIHTDYCQSISISFRRWWVKFTNEFHRYKLHWGQRGPQNAVYCI